jgi:hypothetical protein
MHSACGVIDTAETRFFPRVCCNDIALWEILLLEQSWAKAHPDEWHLKKFYMNTI